MKNKFLIIVSVLIGLSALITAIFYNPVPKIVFIRTGQVMEQYLGTKEAEIIYKNRYNAFDSQLDSIEMAYNAIVDQYTLNKASMSKKEITAEELRLKNRYEEIQQFKAAGEQKLSDENNRYFEGVINQVNAFAKEYAIENNFDYILGTTKQGNLMYAKEEVDITDAFIKSLNEYYKRGR